MTSSCFAFVVISGNTEIPVRNLYNRIQKLSQSDPDEEMTAMEQEFSVSASTRHRPTPSAQRHRSAIGLSQPLLILSISDVLKSR